jgi:hypothetical protein
MCIVRLHAEHVGHIEMCRTYVVQHQECLGSNIRAFLVDGIAVSSSILTVPLMQKHSTCLKSLSLVSISLRSSI